jgi:hypothetical protein
VGLWACAVQAQDVAIPMGGGDPLEGFHRDTAGEGALSADLRDREPQPVSMASGGFGAATGVMGAHPVIDTSLANDVARRGDAAAGQTRKFAKSLQLVRPTAAPARGGPPGLGGAATGGAAGGAGGGPGSASGVGRAHAHPPVVPLPGGNVLPVVSPASVVSVGGQSKAGKAGEGADHAGGDDSPDETDKLNMEAMAYSGPVAFATANCMECGWLEFDFKVGVGCLPPSPAVTLLPPPFHPTPPPTRSIGTLPLFPVQPHILLIPACVSVVGRGVEGMWKARHHVYGRCPAPSLPRSPIPCQVVGGDDQQARASSAMPGTSIVLTYTSDKFPVSSSGLTTQATRFKSASFQATSSVSPGTTLLAGESLGVTMRTQVRWDSLSGTLTLTHGCRVRVVVACGTRGWPLILHPALPPCNDAPMFMWGARWGWRGTTPSPAKPRL